MTQERLSNEMRDSEKRLAQLERFANARGPVSIGIVNYCDLDGNHVKLRYECPARMRARLNKPEETDRGSLVISVNKKILESYAFEGGATSSDILILYEILEPYVVAKPSGEELSDLIYNILDMQQVFHEDTSSDLKFFDAKSRFIIGGSFDMDYPIR